MSSGEKLRSLGQTETLAHQKQLCPFCPVTSPLVMFHTGHQPVALSTPGGFAGTGPAQGS